MVMVHEPSTIQRQHVTPAFPPVADPAINIQGEALINGWNHLLTCVNVAHRPGNLACIVAHQITNQMRVLPDHLGGVRNWRHPLPEFKIHQTKTCPHISIFFMREPFQQHLSVSVWKRFHLHRIIRRQTLWRAFTIGETQQINLGHRRLRVVIPALQRQYQFFRIMLIRPYNPDQAVRSEILPGRKLNVAIVTPDRP
ncbi:hypothetical protein CW360_11980 [Pseudomonas fluvialis]|uniref:Uncharacterized protein n=1 Tax=Pseudomonas fluvialis TaxID=1793966 RepID=A0A2I0CNL1_9PSED|nr:hypothetical protein CW360_11980 [Pseudomonas pharmacofabricae]